MDPRYSAQDIVRCNFCETSVVQSHCELCNTNLCKNCVGEHLSDSFTEHRVVPYKGSSTLYSRNNISYISMVYSRNSSKPNPPCPAHAPKHCELFCEKCDIPVCSTCIASGKHQGHQITDFFQKISSKRRHIEDDLKELQEAISPGYKKIALEIQTENSDLLKHYEELTKSVTKHGENWIRKINIVVNEMKVKISKLKLKHQSVLKEQEDNVKEASSQIHQCITELKRILASDEVSLVLAYKSRNAEFIQTPPKAKFSFPIFSPEEINTEKFNKLFGSLQEDLTTTGKVEPEILSLSLTSLVQPELTTTISTKNINGKLCRVACLSDEEIWTCWNNKIMVLYNLQGKLLKRIQTKSRNKPSDMTVTRSGELVYTDPDSKSINVVKDKEIETGIRLQKWKPLSICSTSSDDLLVHLLSNDGRQSKVVRYSDFSTKQSIEFDDQGKRLYSNSDLKHICENKNLDVCVSDHGAKAVVVVNQEGKLRFRYTGHPFTKEEFNPLGITADSHCWILVTDGENNRIQILNQDGQFLRFIDNCDLVLPWGLCVDSSDNLIVGENGGKVKKIKYR